MGRKPKDTLKNLDPTWKEAAKHWINWLEEGHDFQNDDRTRLRRVLEELIKEKDEDAE